nr:MAG TPA: hypothetical protein [Caudoviricetes sp.]DAN53100.1 MAG TPA: hypothetical protein [Caudoviricetes sp.]DAP62802.1 MAG TPA: hypothetical protein [Caudoviricetes sp.]DAS12286.1 MAG TPA: hypothetical protein [Caudoviricetes sp.]DAU42975.1 MAG TPA: hypothetical protein [Caudoviricetes sp.]
MKYYKSFMSYLMSNLKNFIEYQYSKSFMS